MILPGILHAEDNDGFLHSFIEGDYILIGKAPDSDRTYHGKVKILKNGGGLDVVRIIDKKEIKAKGKIETAADNVKVLRVRFKKENQVYEGTYLLDSDLDNYGRLTGYVYLKAGGTRKAGLEALFINHDNNQK